MDKGQGDFSLGSNVWPGTGKLGEEAGEVQAELAEVALQRNLGRLSQVIGKLVSASGLPDHWDGTNLKERLEDELGDLAAAADRVIDWNHLDRGRIYARRDQKRALFQQWHEEGLANVPLTPDMKDKGQ